MILCKFLLNKTCYCNVVHVSAGACYTPISVEQQQQLCVKHDISDSKWSLDGWVSTDDPVRGVCQSVFCQLLYNTAPPLHYCIALAAFFWTHMRDSQPSDRKEHSWSYSCTPLSFLPPPSHPPPSPLSTSFPSPSLPPPYILPFPPPFLLPPPPPSLFPP